MSEDLPALFLDDVKRFGGRWLDLGKCATCGQPATEESLLFCAFHQIILCWRCFTHGVCQKNLGSVFLLDDLEAGKATSTQTEENHLNNMAFLQLLGPNHDRRGAR